MAAESLAVTSPNKTSRSWESLLAYMQKLSHCGKLSSWLSSIKNLTDFEKNWVFQILHQSNVFTADSSSLESAARRIDLFTDRQRQHLLNMAVTAQATAVVSPSSPFSSASTSSPSSPFCLWMCLNCKHPNNANDVCSKCNQGRTAVVITKKPPQLPSKVWIKTPPEARRHTNTFWIRSSHIRNFLGPNGKTHKSLIYKSGVDSIILSTVKGEEWSQVRVRGGLSSFMKLIPMVQELLQSPPPPVMHSKIIWIHDQDIPLLIGVKGTKVKELIESIQGLQNVYALQDYLDDENLCPVSIQGYTAEAVQQVCKKLELLHDGIYKDSCTTTEDVIRLYDSFATTPPNTPTTGSPSQQIQEDPKTISTPFKELDVCKETSKIVWLSLWSEGMDQLIGDNGSFSREYKKPIQISIPKEEEAGAVRMNAYLEYLDKNQLCPVEIVGAKQDIRLACTWLERSYGLLYHKKKCATLEEVIVQWEKANNDKEMSSPPTPSTSPTDVTALSSPNDITTKENVDPVAPSLPNTPLQGAFSPIGPFTATHTKSLVTPSIPSDSRMNFPIQPSKTPLGQLWTPRDLMDSDLIPTPTNSTPRKLFAPNSNPLSRFLEAHKRCFRTTVEEFYTWLESEDILNLQDLSEALEQDEYVEKMKDCGFKKYMKDIFHSGVEAALNQEEPPAHLICPLSKMLFQDPVVVADGYTYERTCIETWMTHHDESPKTSQPLAKDILIPNMQIQNLARAWRREQDAKRREGTSEEG